MSSIPSRPVWLHSALAAILFSSGLCALVYQTVWLREFRLIFGGAAPAAAAVMAVFMGGLGLGGWWFGKLIERVRFPFRFYARLEIAIAVAAMATPYLLKTARSLYIATGGVQALGGAGATLVQILSTLLVLAIPCFLMGGTLPAAMKFAQRDDDPRRSTTAFFYAINVAGAVTGAALGTFWLLGTVGNQATLTLAGLVNAALAGAAWLISSSCERDREPKSLVIPEIPEAAGSAMRHPAPVPFVLAAAFVSGFTFFVIELLWYRISAPLLGGSVYSFGLILCVALAGMGVGGLLYSWLVRHHEPSMEDFVLVSALQAATVILPEVMGDDFAFGALVTNYLTRGFGFGPLVAGWTLIVTGLAFLPSLIAGIQFPLLVSLLGRGNTGVGRELGRAYLCNTAGAILGSLLGGFVFIPMLGLRHCWLAVAAMIGLMPIIAMLVLYRLRSGGAGGAVPRQGGVRAAALILVAAVAAVLLTTGPTSVWFHFPIGYGRTLSLPNTPEKLEEWKRTVRRSHIQSFDGRETSVSVMCNDQYLLLTNGKADGSSLGDAATQVMLGLTGAALHPNPKRACVIGLGTGTTVGWLAGVPGIEHVDCVEIEERMQDMARLFTPVNRSAMSNPKVRQVVGDAREFLVTPGESYDLIVSEPSNPYRAGVAALYTREFYRSVRERLNTGGILCQWVQGYEATPESINMVLATLGQEFPKVELWNTFQNDLLIVASLSEKPWNADLLRTRLKEEPLATAARRLWFTDSAEGFLAHCLANQEFTRGIAGSSHTAFNTDDLNLLEFSYARNIGKVISGNALSYREKAYAQNQMLPQVTGRLDEELLGRELLSCLWSCSHRVEQYLPRQGQTPPPSVARMREAFEARAQGRSDVFEQICAQVPPRTVQERWAVTTNRAIHGSQDAPVSLKDMEPLFPEDVALLKVAWAYARRDYPTTRRAFIAACQTLHQSAWVDITLLEQTLALADALSSPNLTHAAPEDAKALFQALHEPFLAGNGDDMRLNALTVVSGHVDDTTRLEMIKAWGPDYPWRALPLALRASTYMSTHDPRLGQAMEEFQEFIDGGGELPKPRTAPATAPPSPPPPGTAANP